MPRRGLGGGLLIYYINKICKVKKISNIYKTPLSAFQAYLPLSGERKNE